MSPDTLHQAWPDTFGKSLGSFVSDIIGCLPCTSKTNAENNAAILASRPSIGAMPAGVGLIFEICSGEGSCGDALRVHCVLPGSDAGLKGVAIGDYLQEVDGIVVATDMKEARACLYGDAGTSVQLVFKRASKETGRFRFYTVDVLRKPTGTSMLDMGFSHHDGETQPSAQEWS